MGLMSRGIAADAVIVDPGNVKLLNELKAAKKAWQPRAWKHYDLLPEVHYPSNFLGWALSRFDVRIGRRRLVGGEMIVEDTDHQLGWEALYALDEGDGIGELCRLFGVNWTMAADCWLIGQTKQQTVEWKIWSVNEVEIRDDMTDKPTIYVDDERLTKDDYARRLWKSHPSRRIEADGAMQSLDKPCTQLTDLYDSITAQIQSRLASAGLLFIPNTIQMPGAPSRPNGQGAVAQDPVLAGLTTAMMTGITRRDTAAGKIPILLRGPEGAGEHIVHITLDRLLTETEMKLRSEIRQEIAQGLDLPPEVQSGMADMNHWTTWSVMDSSFRNHLQPTGEAFFKMLTKVYLRPYLIAAGASATDIRELVIYGDGTQLISRANESEETAKLREDGVVNLKYVRTKHGANDQDALEGDERIRWIGEKIADPYLATYGLPEQTKIDWDKVSATKKPPAGPGDAGRPKVSNGNSTAGRPGGGAGGNAGGVKGKKRVSELAPAALVAYRAAFTTVGARLRAKAVADQRLADLVKGHPNDQVHIVLASTDQAIARQAVSGVMLPLLEGMADDDVVRDLVVQLEDRMTIDVALGARPSLTLDVVTDMIGADETDEELSNA